MKRKICGCRGSPCDGYDDVAGAARAAAAAVIVVAGVETVVGRYGVQATERSAAGVD